MKKIVAVGVVLLLVLLVAPWGIGRVAEQRVNAGLDQLTEKAPYLKVVNRKWTGGWFRSEQEVTVEVFGDLFRAIETLEKAKQAGAPVESDDVESAGEKTGTAEESAAGTADAADTADTADTGEPAEPAKPPTPVLFTVRNEILHGPVLWTSGFGIARVNTRVVLDEEIRKKIAEYFGTDEPLHITSRVGFFGGGSTRFWGEGHKVKLKNNAGTITYDDFRLDVGYSSKFDELDYDGKWPRLVFEDAQIDSSMRVDDMTFVGKSKRVRGDLYEGGFRFAIDKVSITDPAKAVTSIEGVHYIGDSKMQDEFMSMSLKLGSGKVVNKALQELKLDLQEVHYDFTLRRIHAETLEKLVASIKGMYTKPLATPEEVEVNFVQPFKEQALALLAHDPEFAIDRLGIVTPEGEGVIKGVIKLKGLTAEDFGSQAGAPPTWLNKIEADLTIESTQKLIEKLPNGATGAGFAVDQGFARREGDKLVSHIEFKQATLTVNGKPVPLPGLGGGPAAQGPPGG